MRLAGGILAFASLASPVVSAATPAIAAGTNRTCAVNSAGAPLCWGDNSSGALGNYRSLLSTTPGNIVRLPTGIAQIASTSSAYHSCALTTGGQVLCWGNNASGQLGNGTITPSTVAAPATGLTSGVTALAVGGNHSCALTSGSVVCWGDNFVGQLGSGDIDTSYWTYVSVSGLPAGVRAITAGIQHTCALTAAGGVMCWGDNESGQLGNGSSVNSETPVAVTNLASGVVAISAGFYHTCALTASSAVLCWGRNVEGELGNGSTAGSSIPVLVSGLSSPTQVAAGGYHSCAINGSGSVSCWGLNSSGELGNGTQTDSPVPVGVSGLTASVRSLALGYLHSCALTASGGLQCWGYNGWGQYANGAQDTSFTAVASTGVPPLASITAGTYHTCGVTTQGVGLCWGGDNFFQLGNGEEVGVPTPGGVYELTSGITAIATGFNFTCAVTQVGGMNCWGSDGGGQLGNGTKNADRSHPVAVTLPTTVVAVTAGSSHACALTTAGGVLCWGFNTNGGLGDGTLISRSLPVAVSGLSSGVVAVNAGLFHTCAVTSGGSVLCWGFNSHGQLGNGTTTDSPTPQPVSGVSGVVATSAGVTHTCALTTGGAVLCWGQNGNGRLGDGTTSDRLAPVPVVGLSSGARAIAAGRYHTCALMTSGSVLCWGDNYYGQLGNGKTTDSFTPVQVSGLPSNVVAIVGGTNHTCGLTGSGLVYCWGYNSVGGVGDSTFATRVKPVVVAHELGSGSLASNNWYLDLNPAIAKTISASDTPSFLTNTSGNAATAVVDVTTSVQFRQQDVGRPIYVFGYVPASLVPGAALEKDAATCVLAQLSPSGDPQLASASGLQSYASNVTSAQAQAVNAMNGVLASKVGGSTFCIGTGSSSTQAVDPGNSRCVASVPPLTDTGQLCVPPTTSASDGGTGNLVASAGFEGGSGSWTQSSTLTGSSIITNDEALSHSGSWYAWLGGYNGGTDTLYQQVSIPAGAGPATLQFWYRITTLETTTATAYDVMTVTVADTSGVRLATLASFSNLNAANGWVQSPAYDLSAFKGRTVRIVFQAVLDSSNFTSFQVDDVTLTSPAAAAAAANASYEGLWLKGDESGWGVNVTHQGTTLFATWFTYDTDGAGMWLVASSLTQTSAGNFSGALYRTVGPAFSANPFNSISFPANYTTVGTLSFSFTDANTGTMSYTVNGVTQSKAIQRFIYASGGTNCTLGGTQGASPNYQDLWLRSASGATEAGWGINITHQGDILFATWFTYLAGAGSTNKGMWVVMSNGAKTAPGVYTGALQTTTGPAFSATPFNPNNVARTTVGSGTFTFTDANNGTFNYTVNGVTQSKPIARFIYASPATVCQ